MEEVMMKKNNGGAIQINGFEQCFQQWSHLLDNCIKIRVQLNELRFFCRKKIK